jgi:hypothetical protein
MKTMVVIALVILAGTASAKDKWTGGPVTVCVTAADKSADGFVAPNAKDLLDSAKDLTKNFSKDQTAFTPVEPGPTCKLAVRVTERGNRPSGKTTAHAGGYAGSGLKTEQVTEDYVVVVVTVAGHEQTFADAIDHGEGAGSLISMWGTIAGSIKRSIKDWVIANRAAIDAQP